MYIDIFVIHESILIIGIFKKKQNVTESNDIYHFTNIFSTDNNFSFARLLKIMCLLVS